MEGSPTQDVLLYRNGIFTGIEKGLPDSILTKLSHRRRVFLVGRSQRIDSTMIDDPGFMYDDDGVLGILSGFVPRVSRDLVEAGYKLQVKDESDVNSPERSWDAFNGADAHTLSLLRNLDREPRGQILISSRIDQIKAIVLINRFFRGRIAVVCENRSEAYRITARLRSFIKGPIPIITKHFVASHTRLEVGTVDCIDFYFRDVVIFARAAQVQGSRTLGNLYRRLKRQRIYGLTSDRERLSPRQHFFLEGLIGPVLGQLGGTRKRCREVALCLANWRCKDHEYGPFGLAWKRDAIWHNAERNESVASIARALVDGVQQSLWEAGIFLESMSKTIAAGHPRKVAILVESPEHAKELIQRLPGWRIMTSHGKTSSMTSDSPGLLSRTGRADPIRELDRTIITIIEFRSLERLALDVLIRADGTPWPLSLPIISDRKQGEERGPLVMIDFHDSFDSVALEATRDRLKTYSDQGWKLMGNQGSFRHSRLE
jgi:hypothetical protein